MVSKNSLFSDRWHVFWALAMANFVGALDMNITFIVLPTLANEFNLPLSGVAWIPLAGTLTIGALLLPIGSLADLLGRKRMQLIGIALISLGSIIFALAPTPAILILGKMISSAGVAIVFTQMMSVIAAVFPDSERGKAIGAGIAASAVGMLLGPLAGGYVITSIGWRAAYWVIGLLAIPGFIATAIIFVESRVSSEKVGEKLNFDWIGAVLIALGISLAIMILNEGTNLGWLSPLIIGMMFGSVFCLVTFVVWELKNQEPLFDLRHFTNRIFTYSILVRFLGFFGYSAIFFILPFLIQDVQGYRANVVGLVIFTGSFGMGIGAIISGRFDNNRALLSFLGLSLGAISSLLFVWALFMNASPHIFAGINLIAGLGFGIWNAPAWALLLASTDKSSYSGAASVMNLVRNTSTLSAVAVATAIITTIMIAQGSSGDLGEIANDPNGNAAKSFVLGSQIVFIISGCFGVGTLFSTILLRKPRDN